MAHASCKPGTVLVSRQLRAALIRCAQQEITGRRLSVHEADTRDLSALRRIFNSEVRRRRRPPPPARPPHMLANARKRRAAPQAARPRGAASGRESRRAQQRTRKAPPRACEENRAPTAPRSQYRLPRAAPRAARPPSPAITPEPVDGIRLRSFRRLRVLLGDCSKLRHRIPSAVSRPHPAPGPRRRRFGGRRPSPPLARRCLSRPVTLRPAARTLR
jgi:hypothetical protein